MGVDGQYESRIHRTGGDKMEPTPRPVSGLGSCARPSGAPIPTPSSPTDRATPVFAELNPAERVFEYLRDAIEGKVYGTIAAKKAAVEAALETLAADPEKVKRLTGWQWIRESVEAFADSNMALQ